MIIKRLAAAAVVAAISCAILPSASFARDVDEAAAASASSAGDANKQAVPPSDKLPYGVDVSWPTHSHALLDPPGGPRGGHADRLQAYQEFMDGCYERYGPIQCERTEYDRVAMNVEQPPTVANYTHAGYAKLPVPAGARRLLGEVWRRNDSARPEYWDEGNSYTNHWKSPTSYLALDRFLTIQQRRTVLHQVQEVLEQWTQTRLVPTSLYGLRVYRRGAVLAPHVDRFPLVISAILNVAQNIDGEDDESGHREDWPLEVIGHDGVAVNVTMKPGEMILYESASVIHGRPFPLKGEYYANLFVHFAPEQFFQQLEQQRRLEEQRPENSAKALYERALEQQQRVGDSPSRKKTEVVLPHYLHEDTVINRERWRQDFVFVREPSNPKGKDKASGKQQYKVKGVTSAHVVAANGNLQLLMEVEKQSPESLFASDSNGWKPLHEAARAGSTEIVEYLIKKGADVNERTNDGRGANALWWAEHALPENHPTVLALRRHGGAAIGPND